MLPALDERLPKTLTIYTICVSLRADTGLLDGAFDVLGPGLMPRSPGLGASVMFVPGWNISAPHNRSHIRSHELWFKEETCYRGTLQSWLVTEK